MQLDRRSFVPLYRQLRLWIEEHIKDGTYPPGTLLPPEREICEMFDVSNITVRRALGELANLRAIYRSPGLGTFVSSSPRPLRLALAMLGFDEGWWLDRALSFGSLVGGIGKAAWQSGAQFALVYVRDSSNTRSFVQTVAEECSFDGLLIRGNESFLSTEQEEALGQLTVPCVSIYAPVSGRHVRIKSLVMADEEDTYRATRHLIDLGHRRIGYAAGPRKRPVFARRLQGYRRALEEAGLSCDESLIREDEGLLSANPNSRGTIISLVRSASPPTGLVVAAVRLVPWAYRVIAEEGLRIPADISIVGSDDGSGEQYVPTLTRFGASHHDLGVRATELLIQMIGGDTGGDSEVSLPSNFRVGASAASPLALPRQSLQCS